MKIAVTGHRPDKLGNEYDLIGKYSDFIRKKLDIIIDDLKPEIMISGMALGVDTIFALMALDKKIQLIAAIPFEGQESKWIESSKTLYNEILGNNLTIKKYVCDPIYAIWKMQKRNEWMVDNCDILIGVWDGTNGGTANCIGYARKKGKKIILINPKQINDKKMLTHKDLQAPEGKFRVISVDTFDREKCDCIEGDFNSKEQALGIAQEKGGVMLKTHVYDDQGNNVGSYGSF